MRRGRPGPLYLDSSAFMKLIFGEPERAALVAALGGGRPLVSSVLIRLEVARAVLRMPVRVEPSTDTRLQDVHLIPAGDSTWRAAEELGPPALRSLDALHLATAESLGSALDAIVTYDHRLTEGARLLGIRTLAPGAGG